MDMKVGVTEDAVSILRYELSLPVWPPSNIIAHRTSEDLWIRIIIPTKEKLEVFRCYPDLTGKDVKNQLQQNPGVDPQENLTSISMVKAYDEQYEVCLRECR